MATVELLTQGVYNATWNFLNDTIGQLPDGWGGSNPYGSCSHTVRDGWNGHKKILRIRDTKGSWETWAHEGFDAQTVGTIEFYAGSDDATYGIYDFSLRTGYPGTSRVRYSLYNDQHRHGDGWVNIQAAADDTWYRIKIEFRCTGAAAHPDDAGLGESQYNIYIAVGDADFGAAAVSGAAFDNAGASVNHLIHLTGGARYINDAYLDAIGLTGLADDYQVGDNQFTVVDTDITSDVIDAKITKEIGKIPKGVMRIKDQSFDEDTVLLMKDDATSWQFGRGLYKAEYNFRDDTWRTVPSGWVDGSAGISDAYIIDKYRGHRKVLQLEDYDGNPAKVSTTISQTEGTMEFYAATTATDKYTYITIQDGSTSDAAYLYFRNNGQIAYIDYIGANDIMAYEIGKWYHFRTFFDTKLYYASPDNYNDETVGTTGDSIAFVDTDNSDTDCEVSIIAEVDNHKNVLQLDDQNVSGRADLTHNFAGILADRTVEMWIGVSDITKTYSLSIILKESTTTIVQIAIVVNHLYYWDSLGVEHAIKSGFITNDSLIHVKLILDDTANTFDCWIDGVLEGNNLEFRNNSTVGTDLVNIRTRNDQSGYVAYVDAWGEIEDAAYSVGDNLSGTWDLWIDGVKKSGTGFTLRGSPITMDTVVFQTGSAATDYLSFIDAIDFSWSSGYTTNRNLEFEVTSADETIFEGQIVKQTREAIQKFTLSPLTEELKRSVGEQGAEVTITADYTPQMINELMDSYNHALATEQDEKYRGTYTFLYDTDNTPPMGCLCDGNVTVAVESIGGHKRTVEFDDDDGGSETLTIFFEGEEYGTLEFWYYCDDPTDQFFVQLKHGTTIVAGVGFDGDEFQYWKDDSTWANCTTIVTGPVASTWYRVRIDFECTTVEYTGLAQYDYSITVYDASGNIIDDVEDDINMDNNEAHIDTILFSTGAVDNGHLVYIDSIGLSWDWEYPLCRDYTVGVNKQKIIYELQASGLDVASANILLEGDVSGVKFLKDHANRELMIWYLNFEKDVCINDGSVDSQIDFSSTDRIWAVKGSDRVQRVNKVIVKGGQTGGARKYATADNTTSQNIYGVKAVYVFIPEVTDDTDDLQAIADSILTEHENAPDQVVLWRDCSDVGMMQVGETVTISASDIEYAKNSEYITAGQWIIKKIVYYPLTQVAKIWLIDSLIYEPDEKEIEFIEKIVNAGL